MKMLAINKMIVALGAIAVLAGGASARAEPTRGGTLTWVVVREPPVLVPLTTSAGGATEIGPKVVEGLLSFDEDLKPRPLLATAWEVSPDGLQYRFTLRSDVNWHDGKPFTSADVASSIFALKQVHPRGRATFANVSEVRTPDDHTAIIVLSKPAPYLLTALSSSESPIVPKHLYEGTDIVANPHNTAPIGTGPFVFKEIAKGSHVILERNPNYWDKPKPYLDRVVVRFVPDSGARAAAHESGEIQIGAESIPLSDIGRFEALPNLRVEKTPPSYYGIQQQLYFNFETPALQNRNVRKAIAQAIDVEALNKVVWYGAGTLSASIISKALTQYHNPEIKYYPFDLKAAEAALESAGLKKGPDGKRLTLRLLINPFQERRAADFVRQSLTRIGVDAVIEPYDFATYVRKVYTERAFDLTLESLYNTFDPTVGVQRVYWSKNFKVGLPFSNVGHYVNPTVDRLFEEASVATDESKRRDLFFEVQRVVHADIPSIEFGANPYITVLTKQVKGYVPVGEGLRSGFADVYLLRD
jgi:peptide/nickel transport system substrate-binding protein